MTGNKCQNLAMDEKIARVALAASDQDIKRILGPKTGVAFVGSAKLSEIQRFQMARYGNVPLFIVNPAGGQAEGIPVVKSVLDLPDEIDLVVVRVGPQAAAQVISDCGQRGIRQALVFTDGYAEVGPDGAQLERELGELARRVGVRIIGPNTNDNAFERYPLPKNHRGGSIALITQSGANGRSVVEGAEMGASFYRWVTTGNEVDLEAADFIYHFAGVDEVAAIALYVEGFKSSAKLKVALERALVAGKPIAAIKMGSTAAGAKAAASHTGHLAGADAAVNGLFRQYGVIRVNDLDELLETANFLSKTSRDVGHRCAAYTISGGTAALMAEAADANGITLPLLPLALQEKLHAQIPKNLGVANPVDNGGAFIIRAPTAERLEILDLIAADEQIDILVFGLNAAYGPLSDRIGADILQWAPKAPKAVTAVWTSVITDTQGYRDLVESGVPIMRSFRKCMKAIAAHKSFSERRRRFIPRSSVAQPLSTKAAATLSKGGVLSGADAASLLSCAGITIAAEHLVKDAASAARAAAAVGFPVVMKLISPDIPHKTDHGLVALGVRSETEALEVAEDLLRRGRALTAYGNVDGILVQEHVRGGVEMIVGLSHDPQLGLALTLGAGGIYAEVMNDSATTPLPINALDVREMIAGLRLAPLLDGVRGSPPADKEAFIKLVLAVSALGMAAGNRLQELDLNPVLVQPHRAVVVDALIVAAPAGNGSSP